MKDRKMITNVLSVIALALVLALVVGVLGFVLGKKHNGLSSGSTAEAAAETSFIVTPEAKDVMALSTMPIAKGQSEGAYTLTATVSPGNATNKKVDWAVNWVNASDGWAQGKRAEEYVTVSPSSDGSVQATVSCLQPFGAQIKVTCTSRAQPSIHAECLCDYVKRVESVKLEYYAFSDYGYLYDGASYGLQAVAQGSEVLDFSELLYTAYTVDNALTLDPEACYMNFTDEFLTSFSQYSGLSSSEKTECAKLNGDAKYYFATKDSTADRFKVTIFSNAREGGAFYFIAEACGANPAVFMLSNSNYNTLLVWAKAYPTIFPFEMHLIFRGGNRDCDYSFKFRPDPDNIYTM